MSHPQGHPGMSEIYSLIFVSLSIKKLFQLQAIKPITLVDSIFLFPILCTVSYFIDFIVHLFTFSEN